MSSRKDYNIKILDLLTDIVNKYEDLRFCQILGILNLDMDLFYQESEKTYKNIQELANKHF